MLTSAGVKSPGSNLLDWLKITAGYTLALALLLLVWGVQHNPVTASSTTNALPVSKPASVASNASPLNNSNLQVAVTASNQLNAADNTPPVRNASLVSGTVWSWGYNGSFQLGYSNTGYEYDPRQITTTLNAKGVEGGNNSGLIVLQDGTVQGMGYNGYGQVGCCLSSANVTTPTAVDVISNVTALSSDYRHSLALLADGTVWAWGYNGTGYLGIGAPLYAVFTPTQVLSLTNITAISAGLDFSLALKNDGTVWGWGYNGNGQFGIGNYSSVTVPVQIATGMKGIAAGNGYALFLKNDGTVQASGSNYAGQLGSGNTNYTPNRVNVIGLTGIDRIIAGESHSFAIKNDNTLWGWGNNGNAQVGLGSVTPTEVLTPTIVPGMGNVTKVVLGGTHTLALKSNGTVWSWGTGDYGQLGNSSELIAGCRCIPSPTRIPSLNSIVDIGAYSFSSYAVAAVFTTPILNAPPDLNFGYGRTGTTLGRSIVISNSGNASLTISSTSISGINAAEFNVTGPALPLVIPANGTGSLSVAFNASGNGIRNASLTISSTILEKTTLVSLGGFGTANLPISGTVKAWGYNGYGQLGNGNNTQQFTPVNVLLPAPAYEVSSGDNHSLALLNDGTVWAWGNNSVGQLGNISTTTVNQPVKAQIEGVIAIAAGENSSFAVRSDGTVWAWGSNNAANLGSGGSGYNIVPRPVRTANLAPLTGIVQVRSSYYSSLALKTDGTLVGWGSNYNGQLGMGNSSYQPYAISLPLTGTVQDFSLGYLHALAVKSDGTVWSWGYNSFGQLGNNSTTDTNTPQQIAGLVDFKAVNGGDYHSTAIKTDGTVWAWGKNATGQLGNSTIISSLVPVAVPGVKAAKAASSGYGASLLIKTDGTMLGTGYNSNSQLGNGREQSLEFYDKCSCQVRYTTNPYLSRMLAISIHPTGIFGLGISSSSISSPVLSTEDSFNYGMQTLSLAGTPRSFTISNTGQAPLRIDTASISGIHASNFSLVGVSLPFTLTAGSSVDVNIGFTPNALQTRSATLNLTGTFVEGSVAIPLSGYGVTALPPVGIIKSWGANFNDLLGTGKITGSSPVPTNVVGIGNAQKVVAGGTHALALLADGTVVAWGGNYRGELGQGFASPTISVPVQIPGLKGVIDIGVGNNGVSYAVRSDGSVLSFGDGICASGHGTGTYNDVPKPKRMVNADYSYFTGARAIEGGYSHALIQQQDNSWLILGANYYGQLGLGLPEDRCNPVAFNALPGMSQVVAGSEYNLALKTDGSAYSWGYNNVGQLGIGTTTNISVPVQISSLVTDVKRLDTNFDTSYAIQTDNSLWAWGRNNYGEAGNPNISPNISAPVQVNGLSNVAAATGGQYHGLALKNDGTVWGFGYSGNGQLGGGNYTTHYTPTQVVSVSNALQIAAATETSFALISSLAPRLGFFPANSLEFVANAVGTPVTKTLLLKNTGSSPLIITAIDTSGTAQADFSLNTAGAITTIPVGGSKPITVTFNASVTGQRLANVVVTSNTDDSPSNFPLIGFVDPAVLNINWANAQPLSLTPSGNLFLGGTDQFLSTPDGSKWFKFTAGLNTNVVVSLTNASGAPSLPADYDMAVYKDIQNEYTKLITPKTATEIAGESLPYAYLPYAYLPYAYLPYAYLPYAYLPYAYLPYAYLPYAYLPSDKSAEAHLPFNLLYETNLPGGYQEAAYNGAMSKAIISLSNREGLSPEQINFDTAGTTGEIYVRVRSAGGATSIASPFRLKIEVTGSTCSGVTAAVAGAAATPITGTFKTLILTDLSALPGTPAEKSTMLTKMNLFAARSEVQGLVIDLNAGVNYQRVQNARTQANNTKLCPDAKNILAAEIKKVIDLYRVTSPGLQFIVLAGADSTIPFVRYSDKAGFAQEAEFNPVLVQNYPAQVALKNNLVLSQDVYGAKGNLLELPKDRPPVADLSVGRLVESASEISGMIDAYTEANGVINPGSALSTGYDFVSDVASAVKTEFDGIINSASTETLIEGVDGVGKWTASDLRTKFLGSRHDLLFLAGHFSPGATEAADDTTALTASELNNSTINFKNTLFLSVGCHSGYNIPAEDSVPGQSEEPDWAQTLNRKGMVGIIGTGYQYGDTDLVEYSERLYLNIIKQMRLVAPAGYSQMPLGIAFRQAKNDYIGRTAPFNGLHSKVVLEATLYGLPMMQINTTGVAAPADPSVAGTPTPAASGPGAALGLATTSYTLNPALTKKTQVLDNNGTPITTTYYSGNNGVAVNNIDPLLPLELRNATVISNPNGYVLRGVGFRSGNFTDETGVFPLTAASAYENSRSRSGFSSEGFYPPQPWGSNLLEASTNGTTRLSLIGAQYRSGSNFAPNGTMRKYSSADLRLFYSSNNGNPARANAPDVSKVTGIITGSNITFSADITGSLSAGIQGGWVTYYFEGSTSWQSLDLSLVSGSQWQAVLAVPGGQTATNLRFMVQAVNGVGLVTAVTNGGIYFTPTPPPPPPPPEPNNTSMTILQSPGTVDNQTAPVVEAQLQYTDPNNGSTLPLANQLVNLEVGNQRLTLRTDTNGRVGLNLGGTTNFTLQQNPGRYYFNASYTGNSTYKQANASAIFQINRLPVTLTLSGTNGATAQYSDPLTPTATLRDAQGNGVGFKWLVFVGNNGGGNINYSVQTNKDGVAQLKFPQWPNGTYNYTVYFGGNIPNLGTVEDNFYLSTSKVATSTVTITPEDATTSYIGSVSQLPISIYLTGRVFQANDGFYGNLGLAKINFQLFNSGNTLVFSNTVPAGGDGIAGTAVSVIPTGTYTLKMTVVGGFFTSPTSNPVVISVFDSVNSCLLGNGVQVFKTEDDGSCGTLRRALITAEATDFKNISVTLAAGSTISLTSGLVVGLNVNITTTSPGCSGYINIVGVGNSGDGLTLTGGNSLYGLWVRGFSGRQIVMNNSILRIASARLSCVRAGGTP